MSFSRWRFAVEAFQYLTGNQSGNPGEEEHSCLPPVEDISFRNGAGYDRVTALVIKNAPDHMLLMLPAIPFVEAEEDHVVMIAEPADLPAVMRVYKSSIAYAVSPCREVRSAYLRLLLNTPMILQRICFCAYDTVLDKDEEKKMRIALEKEVCWLETEPEAFDEEGMASLRKRLPQGRMNGPPKKIH